MIRRFLDGKVELHGGDSREVLATLETSSVDSVVCDPPYGILFMGRAWDAADGAPFAVEFWVEVLRVLKPGGHLSAFSGTRTYHRMACAIEDAGFEIRDQLAWAYGSGFPKSLDVSKALDKAAGAEREVVGFHARDDLRKNSAGFRNLHDDAEDRGRIALTAPATPAARQWQGYGTALKPSWEPIVLARKPLIGTVSANVLAHGAGALNIDGCRIEHDASVNLTAVQRQTDKSTFQGQGAGHEQATYNTLGRWPANLIHDGSAEVVGMFPDSDPGGQSRGYQGERLAEDGWGMRQGLRSYAGESGSAARFFYTAKADATDRLGSRHPTVKPIDLMQWLVRLVTPKNGVCLDPFAGTGTTGEAAWREGMRAILIEREEEYQADIARRMELAEKPTKRAAVAASKNNLDDPNSLPLFGGWPVAAE
jgi:DNA modification methylase